MLEVFKRLKEGNERFVSDNLNPDYQHKQRREMLVKGQKPDAVILSCSDSRIVPEIIFDAGLGELFIIRVAGNVANPSSIASIEFAVSYLGVKVVVVLGHQDCGAVTAAAKGGDNGKNINILFSFIQPAIQSAPKNATIDDIVKEHAALTAKELINKSEIIKNAIDKNELKVVHAFYRMDSGKVDFLDE